MKKQIWRAVLIALLLITAPPLWVYTAEQRRNIVLILDASGSMGARKEGRSKMDSAKEVLTWLAGNLPANTNIAVRAYGHHRQDDCTDVELLIPLARKDVPQIKQKVRALKPVGMTPIAGALEAAGKDFAGQEGQGNKIILISDGKETCQGDPCTVARNLHRAGIEVQIDVIGFDISAEERQPLECVAKEGGGQYLHAPTEKELKLAAITEVKQEQRAQAQLQPAPVPPPSQPKRINLLDPKNGGQVFLAPDDDWIETIDGKEDAVGKKGDRVRVFAVGEEVVFNFRDGQPATFNTFSVLIPHKGDNLKEFELLVTDGAATGSFRSIGKFQTVNAKVLPTKGWQEFSFPEVTAKYLKVKLLSSHEPPQYSMYTDGMVLYEFRLFHILQQ